MPIQWAKATIGIVCFIAGAVVAGFVVLHPWMKSPDPATNITFPDEYFSADVPNAPFNDDYVSVQGRWDVQGDGLFYKNNFFTVACDRDKQECLHSIIQQGGFSDYVADIDPPTRIPITKWSAAMIIASSGEADRCSRTTINIDRRNRTAEFVQEPINQSDPYCETSDARIYKYGMAVPLHWEGTHIGSKN
jgi:hypothetical protein